MHLAFAAPPPPSHGYDSCAVSHEPAALTVHGFSSSPSLQPGLVQGKAIACQDAPSPHTCSRVMGLVEKPTPASAAVTAARNPVPPTVKNRVDAASPHLPLHTATNWARHPPPQARHRHIPWTFPDDIAGNGYAIPARRAQAMDVFLSYNRDAAHAAALNDWLTGQACAPSSTGLRSSGWPDLNGAFDTTPGRRRAGRPRGSATPALRSTSSR